MADRRDFLGLPGITRHVNGGNPSVSLGARQTGRWAAVSRVPVQILVDRRPLAPAGLLPGKLRWHPLSRRNLRFMVDWGPSGLPLRGISPTVKLGHAVSQFPQNGPNWATPEITEIFGLRLKQPCAKLAGKWARFLRCRRGLGINDQAAIESRRSEELADFITQEVCFLTLCQKGGLLRGFVEKPHRGPSNIFAS